MEKKKKEEIKFDKPFHVFMVDEEGKAKPHRWESTYKEYRQKFKIDIPNTNLTAKQKWNYYEWLLKDKACIVLDRTLKTVSEEKLKALFLR